MSSQKVASRNEENGVDARIPWERPAFRRIAANLAQSGPGPCNDGGGGGCGPAGQHPSVA
jgi:hypothetical protein